MTIEKTLLVTDKVKATDYCKHGDINKYLSLKLGDSFTQYRNNWKLATTMKKEFNFPLFLVIESMFKCNLKCIMCLHSELSKSKYSYDERLPVNQFKKIMKEVSEHSCPSITFGGTSEPILDERLPEFINLAKESGIIDIMLNTNGTLLSKSVAKEIIISGLTRLRLGFDGINPKTYENIRKGANFDNVKNNIINFINFRNSIQQDIPVVRISCVRLKENENEINDFIQYWKKIVDYVSIQRYKPHEFTAKRMWNKMGSGEKKLENIKCSQPFERLYIRGNGDTYGCCSIVYGPKVGNVFKDRIYDIWNSEKMKHLRKSIRHDKLNNFPNCIKCMHYSYGQ